MRGNVTVLSARDGSLGPAGTGLLVDDRLTLGALTLECNGEPVTMIAQTSRGALTSMWGSARNLGDRGADPTVEVHLRREVVTGGLRESMTVISRSASTVSAEIGLHLSAAAADLSDLKHGSVPPAGPPIEVSQGGLEWADARHRTRVDCRPVPTTTRLTTHGSGAELRWHVSLHQGRPVELMVRVHSERASASCFDADPGAELVDWSRVQVSATDQRLSKLLDMALADLRCLVLTDPLAPQDVFAAAGPPWYLTLFGRDSIWAARMMLPIDLELAAGTLRTLARRQGRHTDPQTAQEPGKILHEVRRTSLVDAGAALHLPPLYYGTVDATALWVLLLHDAWRSGMAEDQVRELLPNLQAAMAWCLAATENETGLLRYVDASGHGLSNQGWKDSGDSMRRRDGTIAEAPIALLEAQAYAAEAARGAARLYDAFGLAGAAQLRTWSQELSDRVREHFWVADEAGRYLAMAIDGRGRPVDGVGSNMGHVLGSGVLDTTEADCVIERLCSPDLLGEFGIGTLGRSNPAYNPIGYHTGSVWTHDNAIALLGMVREGRGQAGIAVVRALVDCAAAVGYRAPELFAGESLAGVPAPYPASCRPQAWAAASAVAIITAVLGLTVDVPSATVRVAPMRPAPFGPVRVSGLRYGDDRFTVAIDDAGTVTVSDLPTGVEVRIE